MHPYQNVCLQDYKKHYHYYPMNLCLKDGLSRVWPQANTLDVQS